VTKIIKIVFVNPADPIGSGFIASLARPGGNATGTTGLTIDLIAKRLEVLQEIAPSHTRIGFVSMQKGISPALDQTNQTKFDVAVVTAKALGMTIAWRPLSDSRDVDVDALFTSILAKGDQALYVVFDPLTIRPQKMLIVIFPVPDGIMPLQLGTVSRSYQQVCDPLHYRSTAKKLAAFLQCKMSPIGP